MGRARCPWESLAQGGVSLRNACREIVILHKAHRRDNGDTSMSAEHRAAYREEADRFQEVMLRLADCTWAAEDHARLSESSRRRLQFTASGREEPRPFESSPLLIDTG